MITELNNRAREILRHVVDAYVETGEPVGSRSVSRRLGMTLSPATIRNVMSDLEEAGLLSSPHTSAGRLPTDAGLRLFVSGLMEVGSVTDDERSSIESFAATSGRTVPEILEEATTALAGLARCAGLVMAPKFDRPLRHIDFVNLGPGRVLVVMVTEDGMVENRVIDVPADTPPSSLQMAANYLNTRLTGSTVDEVRLRVSDEMAANQAQLDRLTADLVEKGLASWAGGGGQLIIRGQSTLLQDVTAVEQLERVRTLFDALERSEQLMRLLDATNSADGVQIFIGSENDLFNYAGCSMVVAPYMNSREQIVGAIGVIGPSRINYARIIPMVDYTAKVIGRLIG